MIPVSTKKHPAIRVPRPRPVLSLARLRDLASAQGRKLIVAPDGFELDRQACRTLAEVRELLHAQR